MVRRNPLKAESYDRTCRRMTDLVLSYLTDGLSPRVKREFEQHLAICPDCVNFLNTYRKTVVVTKAIEPHDIPAKVRENILSFLRKRARRIGVLLLYVISQFRT